MVSIRIIKVLQDFSYFSAFHEPIDSIQNVARPDSYELALAYNKLKLIDLKIIKFRSRNNSKQSD